jgi:hypothetical protein
LLMVGRGGGDKAWSHYKPPRSAKLSNHCAICKDY